MPGRRRPSRAGAIERAAKLAGTALTAALIVCGPVRSTHASSDQLDARWFTTDTGPDAFSRPIAGLDEDELRRFFRGRGLFRQNWVIAPAQDDRIDGIGPLFNRLSCAGCHERNGRGFAPANDRERLRSMLVRLSVRQADGSLAAHPAYGDQFNEEANPGIPPEGRIALAWQWHERRLPDGEVVRLRSPTLRFEALAYGPIDAATLLTSPRVGQPLVGMGLLDAAADRDGHRFGHKANVADLRTQVAAALSADLGLTTTVFPASTCTDAQLACRAAPDGGRPEVDDDQLDDLVFYLARLAVPRRRDRDDPVVRQGERAFERFGCAHCHRDDLRTAGDRARLPAYTDLRLHDMGEGLADGRPDGIASGRQWRTAPLWGLGLTAVVGEQAGYLHDGRARTLTEAILWHDGEARGAREAFESAPRRERQALLRFLDSL